MGDTRSISALPECAAGPGTLLDAGNSARNLGKDAEVNRLGIAAIMFTAGAGCGAGWADLVRQEKLRVSTVELVDCSIIELRSEVGTWKNLTWSNGSDAMEPWTLYLEDVPVCRAYDPVIRFTPKGSLDE